MSNSRNYKCTECGNSTPRHLLVVKKALFTTMGSGAVTKKARVLSHLCPPCVLKDDDWNRPGRVPAQADKVEAS